MEWSSCGNIPTTISWPVIEVFFANETNVSTQSSKKVCIGRISIGISLVGFGEETEETK